MAGAQAIATPTIQVNNETISIIPNSFKYKGGRGERSIRTQSSGGSAVDVVMTENAETKKSMVTFEMLNTAKNIGLAEDWQDALNANAITASDNNQNFTKAFANMTVINDPEVTLSQDGNLTIEFEGSAAV
tara:strand:- start:10206 stop:10598 length:393 start_codon:yes stop_codon:yes gene_type:complete